MSRMHPVHPMLVHVPVACWTLVPFSDLAAAGTSSAFFWQVSALLAAVGTGGAVFAAGAGAMDYARASAIAPRVVQTHAALMATALVLAGAGLVGRVEPGYAALVPAPAWAVALGVAALLVMAIGAGFGGELVYGRGVGVRRDPSQ
jgi:uncharacterized membrane protein